MRALGDVTGGMFSVSFVSYLDNLPVQSRNSAGHEKGSVLIAVNLFWKRSSLCLPWIPKLGWSNNRSIPLKEWHKLMHRGLLHGDQSHIQNQYPTHTRWFKIIWDILAFCGHRTDNQSESTERLRHLLLASLPQWHRRKSSSSSSNYFTSKCWRNKHE